MAKEKSELHVTASTLKSIDIFSELRDFERSEISKFFKGRVYKKNQRILSHNDMTQEVFFVVVMPTRINLFGML